MVVIVLKSNNVFVYNQRVTLNVFGVESFYFQSSSLLGESVTLVRQRGVLRKDTGGPRRARGVAWPGRGYVIRDSRDELFLPSSRYFGTVRRGRYTSDDGRRCMQHYHVQIAREHPKILTKS